MKRLLSVFVIAAVIVVAQGQAYSQCYRPRAFYNYAPYYPAKAVVAQPNIYNDNRLISSYVINFPEPAVVGNTVYGNTPLGGLSQNLSQYDAAELFKLRQSDGRRLVDQGLEVQRSADLFIEERRADLDHQLKMRLLDLFMSERPLVQSNATTSTIRERTIQTSGNTVLSGSLFDIGRQIVTASCVECHKPGGTGVTVGKLDLRDLSALSQENWDEINYRVLTDDTDKIMPPIDSGKVLSDSHKLVVTKLYQTVMAELNAKNTGEGVKKPVLPTVPPNPKVPPVVEPQVK